MTDTTAPSVAGTVSGSGDGERRRLRRRRLVPHAVVAGPGVLAILVLASYGQLAVGRPLAGYDVTTYTLPYRVQVADALRHLRLPLWDAMRFAGAPLLGNPQAAVLYPPHWLLLPLPPDRAVSVALLLHAGIAAAGAYLLARRPLRCSPAGAVVAGAAFALGGFVHGHLGHFEQTTALAWLPWALFAADRTVAAATLRAAARPAAGLGAVLALTALAGHTQYLHMSIAAVALYAVILRPRAATVGRVAAGAVLGLGLAAVQLVPTAMVAADSLRSGGLSFEDAARNGVPAGLLASRLLPAYGGDPAGPVEHWGWLPWSVLLLAAVAVVARPTRRHVALAVLAAAGAVLALGDGTPAFRVAYTLVPGTDLFREPGRWLLLPALAVPLLAGSGLDAAVQRTRIPGARAAALALGVVALAVALVNATDLSGTAIAWGAAAAGGAVTLVAAARRWPRRSGAIAAGLVAVATTELLGAGVTTYAWDLRMDEGTMLVRSLAADAIGDPTGRILSIGREDLTDLDGMRRAVRPNAHVLDDLRSPDGYDGGILLTEGWRAAMAALTGSPVLDPGGTARVYVRRPLDPDVFAELDVAWAAVHPADLQVEPILPPGSERVDTAGDVALWRTPTLGPVFTAGGRVPDGLRLERPAGEPERLVVHLPPGVAGERVVVSEALADGWTASSGVALRPHRGWLMSFDVPAGAERVVLRYRAPGLATGAVITLLSLGALVATLAWARR